MSESINLHIKEIGTGETVHTVKVEKPYRSKVDKILCGMLMRIDTDRFFVDDSEADHLE